MNNQTKLLIAEYKRRLAIMEAATPHNVERHRPDIGSDVWQSVSDPFWDWDEENYRIKPEPKYRAWTIDEVPVGAVTRRKANGINPAGAPIVISKIVDSKIFFGDYPTGNDCHTLFLYSEVSYDFCKTWQPCGVLES